MLAARPGVAWIPAEATFIRLLVELAAASEVQGVSGAQTRSVHDVLEDASTGATQQFAAAVELCKKSTVEGSIFLNKASAMGLLQVFPVQTKRTDFI